MTGQKNLLLLLSAALSAAATASEPLKAPPAPFAATVMVTAKPEALKINGMKMSAGGCGSQLADQYGVVCGSNRLTTDEAGLKLFLNSQPRPAVHISYWGSTKLGWGHPFKGEKPETSFDAAGKSIKIEKKFHAASETDNDGLFTEEIKVLDDGLVNVRYSCSKPADAKFTDLGLFFSFTAFNETAAGKKIVVDSKEESFSDAGAPYGRRVIFNGSAETIKISPDLPGNGFSIIFPRKTHFEIVESREEKDKGNIHKYCAHIRAAPNPDGSIEFNLDMRNVPAESLKTTDSFANVNFWKDDRLHIPDYGKCRNLAPNPSFESGLRYYRPGLWTDYKRHDKPVMTIDDQVAKFGNCSLRISAFKPEPLVRADQIQTFAIPSVPGKKYTFSFYAKGDRKTGLWMNQVCVTGVWHQFPKVPGFGVTDEWKRFSCTVEAPNNVLTFLTSAVYHGNDPSGEGTVWVDGLQIEEGEKATDYTENPICAMLLTADPDNFLGIDQNIDARLKITTAAPNTEGSAECEIEDFFYSKPWRKKFDFKTDEKGVAVVKLPLDGALGTGVYVMRADFTLKDGCKDTDFFRVTRMKFLGNTHKNKDIFASNLDCHFWRGDDFLTRCREIGMGSTNYLPGAFKMPPAKVQEFCGRLSQHGITFTVSSLWERMKDFGVKENLREVDSVTPDMERQIEEAAFQIAKTYPECDIWCFHSEFEGCKLVRNNNIKDFAKIQIASGKGVRRLSPNKKFYLGGSCNMEPRNGTMHVEKYLQAVKEIDPAFKFDGATIHPYRATPEHPDLDDDAACFFSVLDNNGLKGSPVLWEEGIYYPYYNIPEWGLDPHRGCSTDHYRAGCPSYHMGWGERIAAAYFARSWLVALKYQDRVKQFNGWCSWMFMDLYLTPFALQKIPNTLGNLLGDAVFKKDIRFAPGMRCYVFEDEKKRPVAALWSHIPNADRGIEESPKAAFNFKGQNPEFIDLMENPHSVSMDKDGNCEIPVTPFPLFIRGGAGELDKLCASVQGARALNLDKPSIQISAKPLNASEMEISFMNLVTREFKGKVTLNIGGKALEKELVLGGKGSAKITVPLSVGIPADKIAEIKLPVEISETGFKPYKTDLSFTAFAVKKISGDTPDWSKIPSVKITNRAVFKTASDGGTTAKMVTEKAGYPGDFEADYQMAWNDSNLYLRVNVTDDVLYHDDVKKTAGGRWNNDSLQIYIDTLCNARDKETRGFDSDDYNYDFYPNMVKGSTSEPDGAITAFRRYCPEQQLIGGLFAVQPNTIEPEIKGSFKKTEKGYAYDLVIPKRLIAPVELKDGSVCGFCVYLNDHDGKCVKGALSTTSEPGTGGYQNPHLYPVMLLTN